MSLILEALRKLDREKQTADRGFLIVGSAPWAERRDQRNLLIGLVAGVAVALVVGAIIWAARARPAEPAATRVPAAVAVATPPSPGAALAVALPAPTPPPIVRAATTPPSTLAGAPSTAAEPPARAPAAATGGEPQLVLQAITQKDGHPVAVLGDHLVREGDSFDGIHVVRIGAAEVEVEVAGKRRIIHF